MAPALHGATSDDRATAERYATNPDFETPQAEVVAPLLSLIEDAEPLRMGLILEVWRERWDGLWERWRPLRDQLTVFAAAHPSPAIGKIVGEITAAVPQSSNTGWFLGSFVGPSGRADGYVEAQESAEASHKRAEELAQELLAEVRAFGGGPGGEPNA